MNRKTGATAIVPGSHKKVREIEERRREFDRTLYKDSPGHQARDQLMAEFRALPAADQGTRRPELFKRFQNLRNEYPDMLKLEQDAQEIRKNFFDPFTEAGLTPGIVNAKAGDLIIFDTGLYVPRMRTYTSNPPNTPLYTPNLPAIDKTIDPTYRRKLPLLVSYGSLF